MVDDSTTRLVECLTRTVGAPGGSDLGTGDMMIDAPTESVHPNFARACKIVKCPGSNIDLLPCPECGADFNT